MHLVSRSGLFFKKYGWKLLGVLVAVVVSGGVFVAQVYGPHTHHFQITFFDIGQGDASLIEFRDGQRMLVDCGPDQSVLAKLGRALPFFDRRIDYLIITHPDLDHYGGCRSVVERFEVRSVVTNGQSKPDASWQELLQAVRRRGATQSIMLAPSVWNVASTTLEFLSPQTDFYSLFKLDDTNNHSIVFRLLDAPTKKSVLFMADAEVPLEQGLMKKYCVIATDCPALGAQVLKIGHHGSDTSTTERFLRLVDPQKAIISVGKHNHFGHPSRRVLNRLKRQQTAIWRTDEVGDILER